MFIDEMIERVTLMLDDDTPETLEDKFMEWAELLEESWLREDVYYMAALVVGADNEHHNSERVVLQGLVQAFGIAQRRLQVITEKLSYDTKR